MKRKLRLGYCYDLLAKACAAHEEKTEAMDYVQSPCSGWIGGRRENRGKVIDLHVEAVVGDEESTIARLS